MANQLKTRRERGCSLPHLLLVMTGAVEAMEHSLNHMEKAGKFHCPQGPVIIVAKGDIKKMWNVRLWKLSAEVSTRRGTLRKYV